MRRLLPAYPPRVDPRQMVQPATSTPCHTPVRRLLQFPGDALTPPQQRPLVILMPWSWSAAERTDTHQIPQVHRNRVHFHGRPTHLSLPPEHSISRLPPALSPPRGRPAAHTPPGHRRRNTGERPCSRRHRTLALSAGRAGHATRERLLRVTACSCGAAQPDIPLSPARVLARGSAVSPGRRHPLPFTAAVPVAAQSLGHGERKPPLHPPGPRARTPRPRMRHPVRPRPNESDYSGRPRDGIYAHRPAPTWSAYPRGPTGRGNGQPTVVLPRGAGLPRS